MKFNMRHAKKGNRPIDCLRTIDPELRYDDLGLNDDEIGLLASSLSKTASTRVAVHGRGDGWSEVSHDTSYLTRAVPWFGGRYRDQFPGAGGAHINDDSDTDKNTKGNAAQWDADPKMKDKWINDHLGRRSYRVKVDLGPDNLPSIDLAHEIMGDNGEIDGHHVYVDVDDFEQAIALERELKNKAHGFKVIIEPN